MPFKREPDPNFRTSTEHFLYRNRNIRNEILEQTDYLMLVDNYEKLTAEQKEEIKNYRQILRDFINDNKDKYLNEGIGHIPFPKPPEWVGKLDIPKY